MAGQVVGSIERGICVLVGISVNDSEKEAAALAKKILSLRVFPSGEDGDGDEKPWAKSVTDINGGVLLVSQFTLYALTTKGSKPDFHLAMKSDASESLFENFVAQVRSSYDPCKVATGKFGAMMEVSLVNDGPVTINLEVPPAEPVADVKKKIKEAKAARRATFGVKKNDVAAGAAKEDPGVVGTTSSSADQGTPSASSSS